MTFRVETTAAAEQEADALLDWLQSEHAGDAGVRWFLALQDAIASLAEFPARCPLAPENLAFPFEVRHLLNGHAPHVYRILFTIEGETVYVLHIRTVAVNRSSTNQQFAFIRSQRPIAVGCLGS
jgi:plasmid stabilization system protein ParE